MTLTVEFSSADPGNALQVPSEEFLHRRYGFSSSNTSANRFHFSPLLMTIFRCTLQGVCPYTPEGRLLTLSACSHIFLSFTARQNLAAPRECPTPLLYVRGSYYSEACLHINQLRTYQKPDMTTLKTLSQSFFVGEEPLSSLPRSSLRIPLKTDCGNWQQVVRIP